MCIKCEMIIIINLMDIFITSHSYLCVWWECMLSTLIRFQVYNKLLLTTAIICTLGQQNNFSYNRKFALSGQHLPIFPMIQPLITPFSSSYYQFNSFRFHVQLKTWSIHPLFSSLFHLAQCPPGSMHSKWQNYLFYDWIGFHLINISHFLHSR